MGGIVKFPFRKEFIRENKTRRYSRRIEVPDDYKLGAVLIINEQAYPIYNIWHCTLNGHDWYTMKNGKTVYFSDADILNSTVYYTKVKS